MMDQGLAPFDLAKAMSNAGLEAHGDRVRSTGLQALQEESGRVERWVLEAPGGWRFDFTKQCIDVPAFAALKEVAQAADWAGQRDLQFAGAPINETEGRAVLHMALRGEAEDGFAVAGEDVMSEVLATRDAFLSFADEVREGRCTAADGGRFTHVINIGIGGSDLGPVMVHEALAPVRMKAGTPLDVRFVSNVDPFHLDLALQGLDAERTLVVIVSKTFTTQETMANARRAVAWLKEALGDRAGDPWQRFRPMWKAPPQWAFPKTACLVLATGSVGVFPSGAQWGWPSRLAPVLRRSAPCCEEPGQWTGISRRPGLTKTFPCIWP